MALDLGDSDLKRIKATSRVRIATDALREDILSREAADFSLGSEDELCAQLNISRPTLRQVARLLEHEQLLTIKRGPGGGYFARRPDVDMVSHVAAIWLRCQNTTILDVLVGSGPLSRETARRAAANPDPDLRHQLKSMLDTLAQETPPYDPRTFVLQEASFNSLLTNLGHNAPIQLFQSILNDFGLTQIQSNVFGIAERMRQWRESQLHYGRAILDGDPETAELIADHRSQLMTEWLSHDLTDLDKSGLRQALRQPNEEQAWT